MVVNSKLGNCDYCAVFINGLLSIEIVMIVLYRISWNFFME